MQRNQIVGYIVSNSGLSKKLRSHVEEVANRRLGELDIVSAAEQYRYVTWLVEKFTEKYNTLSLDQPQGDSKLTYHEKIGGEDENLTGLFSTQTPSKSVSTAEALSILSKTLAKSDMELLMQLAGDNLRDLAVSDSEDNLHSRAGQISSAVKQLRDKYERNGKFMMPRRVIREVKFDPLTVRFFQRRFNGNPIEYYRENADFYEGLSRTELFRADAMLYHSLRENSQIHLAIPETKFRELGNPVNYFNAHLDTYKGLTRAQLAEKDPSLYNSLRKEGRLAEVIPVRRTTNLTSEEVEKIKLTLLENNGDVTKTAKQINRAIQTVRKYAEKLGLKTRLRGDHPLIPPLRQDEVDKILASYETYERSPRAAARGLGYSHATISRYWKKAGYRTVPRPLGDEQIIQIGCAYQLYNGNARKAAEALPFGKGTIRKYWKQLGYSKANTSTSS